MNPILKLFVRETNMITDISKGMKRLQGVYKHLVVGLIY